MNDRLKLYPRITAEILGKKKTEGSASCFLFNSQTNRGYAVEGLAAILCKNFDGTKTLESLVQELEKDYELEPNTFTSEIKTLIKDLEENGLIELMSSPRE